MHMGHPHTRDFNAMSIWCQNVSNLIYQKGKISFLWDPRNVVYCKFDFHVWHWTVRWQKSRRENKPTPIRLFFRFAPMFHISPFNGTVDRWSHYYQGHPREHMYEWAGIILFIRTADERRRYTVTPSPLCLGAYTKWCLNNSRAFNKVW